jgi:hypothetical protein
MGSSQLKQLQHLSVISKVTAGTAKHSIESLNMVYAGDRHGMLQCSLMLQAAAPATAWACLSCA